MLETVWLLKILINGRHQWLNFMGLVVPLMSALRVLVDVNIPSASVFVLPVEIADSTPSPPAVKDVSKRFPSSDSSQVSTEPAWLALAKRKAKAWSDCPQIIK